MLAKLLWVGELDAVWTPDERIRTIRVTTLGDPTVLESLASAVNRF